MSERLSTRAALWLRVSTEDQHTENQEVWLRDMALRAGHTVVEVYRLSGKSALKGEHRADLKVALADARAGKFEVLYVWALDRLDRETAIGPFQLLKEFKTYGVDVVSHTEPWASTAGPFADLLTLMVGWFANFESVRRGERIRAGLARRRAEGKPVGRQLGATDKSERRKAGYYARHEKGRART